MANLTIKIPNKSYKYINDDSVFQSIIIETLYDYVEKRQDIETKNKLLKNSKFVLLNTKLEEKN
jgi:hypothetical protein